MKTTPVDELERKFWPRVLKKDGEACWEWQGATHDFGYGLVRFWVEGKMERYAHRLSWYLHFGKLGSAHVLHDCDNPKCCRPSHLFLGTHLDNVADMKAKGRNSIGQRHPMAKLTPAIIAECRTRYQNGEKMLALSREFGVTSSIIHRAIYGKGWKGVGEPLEQTVFGRLKPGEGHNKAKLTDAIVREVRFRRSQGEGVTDLAREFGVGKATMSKVLRGEYWKHIT